MRFSTGMNYIEPSDIREISKLLTRPGMISFAGGSPDSKLFPIRELSEAAKGVFSNNAETALQYGTTEGHGGLRDKIADMMKQKGMPVSPDDILITTGAQQAISMTGQVFLNPGDKVLCEAPTYSGTVNAFMVYQPDFLEVLTTDQGVDLDDLEKILEKNPDIKLIYVIPNYQNPTGRAWSVENRKKFIEIIDRFDVAVFEDDPYGDIYFSGKALPSLKSMDKSNKVIYAGSFSKVLCPGLRIGWITASPEILRNFIVLKQTQDIHTSQLTQDIVNEYLNNNDLGAQIKRIRKVYAGRKQTMLDAMDKHFPEFCKYTRPEGGMFIWVSLPEKYNTREILKKAIDEGVAFIPGGGFFVKKGHENCMRLCFSSMEDSQIEEGIKRLGKIINEL